MAKMKKMKSPQRTKAASTASLFNKAVGQKIVKEAQRQVEEGSRKFAITKRKLRAQEAQKLKARTASEHPLVRSLSSHFHDSGTRIHEDCHGDLENAKTSVLHHLSRSTFQRDNDDQSVHDAAHQLAEPCHLQKFNWQRTNSQRSGTTTLDAVMKALSTEIRAVEGDLALDRTEYIDLVTALQQQAKISTENQSASLLSNSVLSPTGVSQSKESSILEVELEAEEKKVLGLVKQEDTRAIDELKEADQIYVKRCNELDDMQRSFLGILADDEY